MRVVSLMSSARHDDALNERPALMGLVTSSAIVAIELPFIWGLRVACPCIYKYSILLHNLSKYIAGISKLFRPQRRQPWRALLRASPRTSPQLDDLFRSRPGARGEPWVSRGAWSQKYRASPPLTLSPVQAFRAGLRSPTLPLRASKVLGRFLGSGLRFRHRSNRKPTLGSPRKPQCRPRWLCWCLLCCS